MFPFNRIVKKSRFSRIRKWRYVAAGASTLIGGIWSVYSYVRRVSDAKNTWDPAEILELNDVDFSSMTKDELYELAQKNDIDGRSSMSKGELIVALENTQ